LQPNVPVQASAVEVALEPIDPAVIVTGSPGAAATPLALLDTVEIGVWEMSIGTARDTEVDEVFVVIAGSATVEVAGGPRYDVGAGDIVRLNAGDQTTWTVHESLRKVYVALG
jgi:uncharacterized cupin superfamily protein